MRSTGNPHVAPEDVGVAVGKLVVGAEVLGAIVGAVGEVVGAEVDGAADGTEVDGAADGTEVDGASDGAVLAGDADGAELAGDADGVEVDGAADGVEVDGAVDGDSDEHETSTTALTAVVKFSNPLTSMTNVLLGVDAMLLSRVESGGAIEFVEFDWSTATTTMLTPSARTISAWAASFSAKRPKIPKKEASWPVSTTTSTRLAAPCARRPAVSFIRTFRMWSRPPLTLVDKPTLPV